VVVVVGFVKLFSAACLAGSACTLSLLALLLTRGNVSYSTAFTYVAVLGSAAGGLLYLGVDALLTFGRRGFSGLVLVRDRGGRVISLKRVEGEGAEAGEVLAKRAGERRGAGASARGEVGEGWGLGPLRGLVVLRLIKAAIAVAAILEGYLVVALALGTTTPIMVVPSTSMAPTLNVGDLIVVRGVDPTTIRPGDVIVFDVPPPYDRYAPSPIVHRVVEVRAEDGRLAFVTKGDNLPSPDGWLVPAENVRGVCVAKVPYIGYPAVFFRTPYGIVALAVIIALVLFLPLKRCGGGGGGK
jgi:signal peptidase